MGYHAGQGAERVQVDTSDGKGLTEKRQPLITVRDSACSGFEPFPIVRQVSGAFAGGAPSKELIQDGGGRSDSGGSSYRLPTERLRLVDSVNHGLHHPRQQGIIVEEGRTVPLLVVTAAEIRRPPAATRL
jgi:hypothetical protein